MPGEFDFSRMQEEAVRRAREMQSRARYPQRSARSQPQQARERGSSPSDEKTPIQDVPPPSNPSEPPLQQSNINGKPEPSGPPAKGDPGGESLLGNLFQDKERTIILALLILLGGEEGSHELMFALLFLLM